MHSVRLLLLLSTSLVSGGPYLVTAPEKFVATTASGDRSPKWPALRDKHIKQFPSCICCGRKADQVHHLKPFALYPELELDPKNLRSMCRDCHFAVGHLWNYSNENPDLDRHAEMLLKSKNTACERRKNPQTSRAPSDRPPPVQQKSHAASPAGPLHWHRCACGHSWSHGNEMHGDRNAHTCPRCGRVIWEVSVNRPEAPALGNCPSGNCPIQFRRR